MVVAGAPAARHPAASAAAAPPPPAPAPTLPIAAGLWGLLAITAVLIALHVLAALAAGHLPVVPGVILVSFALYGPMAGFCFYASRRWGTGRVRADLGVRAKPIDAAIGLAVAFIALQAERIALLVVEVLHLPVRSNTEGVSISDDRGLYLTLAAVAIVAAPLVEELFFRGLLLSALRSRLGPVAAVAAAGGRLRRLPRVAQLRRRQRRAHRHPGRRRRRVRRHRPADPAPRTEHGGPRPAQRHRLRRAPGHDLRGVRSDGARPRGAGPETKERPGDSHALRHLHGALPSGR